jgi:TRAP-type mannitol/chloroaromatic compound transport system permease small subunit
MSLRGVVFIVLLKQVAVVACSSYNSIFLLLLFVGLIIFASANKLATKYLINRVSERYVLYSRYFYRFLILVLAVLLCLSTCSY